MIKTVLKRNANKKMIKISLTLGRRDPARLPCARRTWDFVIIVVFIVVIVAVVVDVIGIAVIIIVIIVVIIIVVINVINVIVVSIDVILVSPVLASLPPRSRSLHR